MVSLVWYDKSRDGPTLSGIELLRAAKKYSFKKYISNKIGSQSVSTTPSPGPSQSLYWGVWHQPGYPCLRLPDKLGDKTFTGNITRGRGCGWVYIVTNIKWRSELNPERPWVEHMGPVSASCWRSEDILVISDVDTPINFYTNYCDTSRDNLTNKLESKMEHLWIPKR